LQALSDLSPIEGLTTPAGLENEMAPHIELLGELHNNVDVPIAIDACVGRQTDANASCYVVIRFALDDTGAGWVARAGS
jgi:hypothetical protein